MRKLNLLGNRVVLQPLRRQTTDGGILIVDRYNDERQQWRVLQVGPKVDPSIVPGAQVVSVQSFEPDHEWTDGVIIADARHILAVFVENGV